MGFFIAPSTQLLSINCLFFCCYIEDLPTSSQGKKKVHNGFIPIATYFLIIVLPPLCSLVNTSCSGWLKHPRIVTIV